MYIEVLLPIYLDRLLTYSVPEAWHSRIVVGGRVAVNIGKSKVMAGIVIRISEDTEHSLKIKDICEIIDTKPIITTSQITIWKWISDYYLCTLGEVMKFFLPSSMRISGQISENILLYNSSQSIKKSKELFVIDANTELGRAKKQKQALQHIIENGGTILRNALPYSSVIIKALIDVGAIAEREITLFSHLDTKENLEFLNNLKELSAAQKEALEDISTKSVIGKPILLHGVSGAGKTEIYLHKIAQTLENGKSAVMLLPELAVTTQIVDRIKECFGNRVLTYTSADSPAQRYKTYNKLLTQKSTVVVGTRIAVALPFNDLGLIVVDEEHDSNYKQSDKRPYFNARDTAVIMGNIYGCEVILASATPSIESYYNCKNGKYSLVKLQETFTNSSRPKIHIIDRRNIASKDKQVYGYRYDTRYLSKFMLTKIKENIEVGNQTLILHNKKGFSSYMECGNCSWTPQCHNCNTTLTFHKKNMILACNYCGERHKATTKCPQCGGNMILHGIGAENVEEKIERFFPQSCIARIDGESMRNYKMFKNTLSTIERGEVDIVVGTQIIAKGFNFPKATLACVVNIDTSLNYPDFRSAERTFQLLTQFAGRTSRNTETGNVIIQTSHPDDKLFTFIKNGDYDSMYQHEIITRKEFMYPPFCRMIKVVLRHPNKEVVYSCTGEVEALLRKRLVGCLINVDTPLIDKVRQLYLMNISIRAPKGINIRRVKEVTFEITTKIGKEKKLATEINVDI